MNHLIVFPVQYLFALCQGITFSGTREQQFFILVICIFPSDFSKQQL